jgi:hypothetical protein
VSSLPSEEELGRLDVTSVEDYRAIRDTIISHCSHHAIERLTKTSTSLVHLINAQSFPHLAQVPFFVELHPQKLSKNVYSCIHVQKETGDLMFMNNVSWGRSGPQHYAVVADDEREGARGVQLVQPGQCSATTPNPPQMGQVLLRKQSIGQ